MNAKELKEYNKNRQITQICIVTDDYMRTIKFLTEKFQWGPWTIGEDTYDESKDKYCNSIGEDKWSMYFGVTYVGKMEIEIIQPIYGLPIFESFLKEKGVGIHHFKESISGIEELNDVMEKLEKKGLEKCFSGFYNGEHWTYFDSNSAIGAYLEVSNDVGGNGDLSLNEGYIGRYPKE